MKMIVVLLCSSLLTSSFGGTAMIAFVHQPLHALGTEGDAGLFLVRIPIIVNAVPEAQVSYVAHKNKLLQREPAFAEDSNILSCLGVGIGGEWFADSKHFEATIDLTEMKSPEPYGVTAEEVVKAAVECVRLTILEMGGRPVWKIKIKAREADATKWKRFETEVSPEAK